MPNSIYSDDVWGQGDVIQRSSEVSATLKYQRKILGVCGEVYFLSNSFVGDIENAGFATLSLGLIKTKPELTVDGWSKV